MPRLNFVIRRQQALFLSVIQFIFIGRFSIWWYSGIAIFIINACAITSNNKEIFGPVYKQNERIICQPQRVIDGDSIIGVCSGKKVNIRLLGIDAPEIKQSPWGKWAKQALQVQMDTIFELEPYGQDIYGRQLGVIWSKDKEVNLSMIRLGMAIAYKADTTPASYFQAEKEARTKKIGIWSYPGSQQNPRKWRRYHQ